MPESDREEITALKKRVSDLGTTYMSNLNEDATEIAFEEKELDGVPEDLIRQFKKVGRRFLLVFIYTERSFAVCCLFYGVH